KVTQDGGAQERLRREAEDGAGGAGSRGSAGAPAEGTRARARARALEGGRTVAESARGGRGRGGRARVAVRRRACGARPPHLRVGLQLLGSAGRAQLRAAQRRARAPRRLPAAPQDPARALPSGAGPKARGYEYVLEPSPVPLPLDRPQETRVLQVSCGRAHSLVLTDREGVFSLGNNSYGQCGRKVVEDEVYSESHKVHRLQDFDGQVVQVACGQDHSLFVTDRGEVYSCGWGADGQTGLGHYNITSTPTKLGGDLAGVHVVQVATYGDCCLAVSADGGVFGWGNSEYRQLASVTDSTQVNVPRRLPFSGVGKVEQAACGGTGCAVVNGEGRVFVWGYGILGKGPNLVETALPEMIPPTLFGLTEFSPEVRISQVRCGLSHFAALTSDDAWGARGRGLRCGSHGDSGQVVRLSLLPGPELRVSSRGSSMPATEDRGSRAPARVRRLRTALLSGGPGTASGVTCSPRQWS
uniref:RCC1 like n=1 Tax=Oryctolagus cuniculus TaxID=9986 RepID=A0A5F9CF66_RABIT